MNVHFSLDRVFPTDVSGFVHMFTTNSECLHKILGVRCSHHIKHAWPKETHADLYLVKLCRHAVQQILKMERWNLVQHVLHQATLTQALTAETENSGERGEVTFSALPASDESFITSVVILPIM